MKPKLTRRQFLALGGSSAIAAGGGLYAGRAGCRDMPTTFKTISGFQLEKRLRILHLSDFHASRYVSWEQIRESVERGLAEQPDLVFLTGDFVTNSYYDFTPYSKYLEALKGHPHCYACLGNHDGVYGLVRRDGSQAREIDDQLRQVGVQLLHNRAVDLQINGTDLRIAGLGDLWRKEVRPKDCLKPAGGGGPLTLLLAHNPDTKSRIANYRWDVMFAGHTHGGQLVVPLLGWRPFMNVKDKSMAEGVYRWKDRHIHITRGVGNLHGIRINCPAEISIIDLT